MEYIGSHKFEIRCGVTFYILTLFSKNLVIYDENGDEACIRSDFNFQSFQKKVIVSHVLAAKCASE